MAYSLVVFDWDGTVVDSTHSIVVAIQEASRDLGLSVPSDEQASWVIGLSLSEALAKAVPDLTPELYDRFIERYRVHYFLKNDVYKVFDGMLDLFQALIDKGVWLAVATGKSKPGLVRSLETLQLTEKFVTFRTADETFSKPNPQMLYEILNELNLTASDAIMVGDTTHDVQMAQNANMNVIALTYGAHSKSELVASNPNYICHDVSQLSALLLKLT